MMIDLKLLRENPAVVRKALEDRGSVADLDGILKLDNGRRDLVFKADELKRERNEVSQKIAALKKAGENASELIEEMRVVADNITSLDARIREKDDQIRSLCLAIPNIPHPSVPFGRSEEDNPEIRRWGEPPSFDF